MGDKVAGRSQLRFWDLTNRRLDLIVRSIDRARSIDRPLSVGEAHLEVSRGVRDRGTIAGGLHLPWLAAQPQLIIGTTLLAAGLWQFSPLRDRCLDECRSPLGFVLNRWRGVSERREALAMGIAHGAFCVGCCWSLMLVMFGVGLANVTAMLVLGGITAIEKNLPSGRRLTHPLGLILVLAAAYSVAA